MQQLPYELLQQISSSLLPRYQCRFALTSRQNYDCLYSPLLRWHAQKAAVAVPKYRCTTYISVIEANNNLTVYKYEGRDRSIRYNLTELYMSIGHRRQMPMELEDVQFFLVSIEGAGILNGFYKHMSGTLIMIIRAMSNKLINLPLNVLNYIFNKLPRRDRKNLLRTNLYLRWILTS